MPSPQILGITAIILAIIAIAIVIPAILKSYNNYNNTNNNKNITDMNSKKIEENSNLILTDSTAIKESSAIIQDNTVSIQGNSVAIQENTTGLINLNDNIHNRVLPGFQMENYNFRDVRNYLMDLKTPNILSRTAIVPYLHSGTISSYAYTGSVFSPNQNRIYFIPSAQASATTWNYIDCNDNGAVVTYPTNLLVPPVNIAYSGGAYSPSQNRIYFHFCKILCGQHINFQYKNRFL